ncbi:UNKNOWN [Stylonychia lemnae]|uniref:RING-type domain-containing protein n=1 Tax=Stylonychia lemnae TaxID=5949 RepID=A0A078BEP2_STYLE|nr:UNKNOWN [Stylonychia lemnae]|eukprot:CDW91627.1 UNKNOWN [Stylonychia lemnae]
MASSNPYYEEWKQGATYSRQFQQTMKQDQEYQDNQNKFWACTEDDWQVRQQQLQEERAYDPKATIKNQFVLDKNQSQAPVNKYIASQDYQTSNHAFHQMTENSQNKLRETQGFTNPVIEGLQPEVFEVSAKRNAPIWKTDQYKDPDFRENLNATTNRNVQNYDAEIAQKMRVTKHNIKVTNISEYSNALNRGSVFINPKFGNFKFKFEFVMAKNRGCSCWPFSRTKTQTTTQSQLPRIKNEQIQKGIQRPDLNFNPSFTNHSNTNFLVIQRSQLRSDSQLLVNPLIPNMVPFIAQSSVFEEVRNRNKVRIKTTIQKSQVKYKDEYPTLIEEQKIYKYCCPICLRYFNTILVSTCCQNYLCRMCIGDMAKKAKKDINFIIRCPHCFENDFKLHDVNQEEKVKFYTDTPFKFTKTQKEELENSIQKINNSSEDKHQHLQNSSQIVSPSFQVHITDISYKKEQRHNDIFSLNPVLINRQESVNLLPPIGDNEQPIYESPYPKLNNLDEDNNQLFEENLAFISPEEERKSQFEVQNNVFLSQRNILQGSIINSIHSNRPVYSSLIDQVQNHNQNSYRFFKSERNQHCVPLHPIDNIANRQSMRFVQVRDSLNRIKLANNSIHRESQIGLNQSLISKSLNFQHLDLIDADQKAERTGKGSSQFRLRSNNRQLSSSNHSNKSEEVKSTIHKQVNAINMFKNENFFENIPLSFRQSQTEMINKEGFVSIKELIAQRNAQSDKKVVRRISDHIERSGVNRNSQIHQSQQLLMSPSLKFKDLDDERNIDVSLRGRLQIDQRKSQ